LVVVAAVILASFSVYLFIGKRRKFSLIYSENVVLITGCDTGFGYMSSLFLAEKGFQVISACLTEAGRRSLEGKVALSVLCDVTKEEDLINLKNLTEAFINKRGLKLWALVNNAGIAIGGFLDWTSMQSIRKVLEVNFFGVVSLTKLMLPLLKRTRNSRIINLSSLAGISGSCGLSSYCASKHALEGLIKCIRQELRPWGIHVSNVNPGFMNTPIVSGSREIGLREFEAAPADVQSQYSTAMFADNHAKVAAIQEDPILVVREIAELITDANPPQFNVVGKLGFFLRYFVLLPYGVQEFLVTLLMDSSRNSPTQEAIERYQGKGRGLGPHTDTSNSKPKHDDVTSKSGHVQQANKSKKRNKK